MIKLIKEGRMGGKPATLTIHNELPFELTDKVTDVEHGKIVSGEEPPDTIANGGFGVFEVSAKER